MSTLELARDVLYSEHMDQRVADLKAFVLHRSGINDDGSLRVPDNDVYQRAFLEAFHGQLDNPAYPALNQGVRKNMLLYPDRKNIHIANYQLRAAQDTFLTIGWPYWDYPLNYADPEPWDAYPALLEESPLLQDRYDYTSKLFIRTNFADRGALVKFAGMLLGHENDQYIIEAGCSRNHIGKKLAYPKRRGRYAYPKVIIEGDFGGPETTENVYNLLNQNNFPVASVIGIDLLDMMLDQHTPEAAAMRLWDQHSFYPKEYLPHDRQNVYDFINYEHMPLDEVTFFQGDLTDLDHDSFEAHQGERPKANLACFWCSAYQIRSEGMPAAIDNLARHMQPDGKILIFDYVTIDKDGTMDFSEDWAPNTCRGYVLDLARREDGWQEILTIESPRVHRARLTEYAARLAVKNQLPIAAECFWRQE